MSPSHEQPLASTNLPPSTPAEVAAKLDQIMQAILPLHGLLKGQEEMDQSLTDRLTQLLEHFGTIVTQLEAAATALTEMAGGGQSPGEKRPTLQSLGSRMNSLETTVTVIHQDLQTLMGWLGAPLGQPPEVASSGKS